MDDALHRSHDELSDVHWWLVGRRAIFQATLRRHLRPVEGPRRILDAGCGTGGNLPMLGEFGEVTGVEPSPLAFAAAVQRVGSRAHLIQAGIPEGIPTGQTYDLITLFDVLEHLEHPVVAARSLMERLTPAGQLLVTVPAFSFLWSTHDVQNGHFRRYDVRLLRDQLSQAGLTVDFFSYYNSLLFPAVAAVRFARRVVPAGDTQTELAASATFANRLLTRLFSAERHVVTRVPVPFGVSLLAMASKR